MKNLLFLLAVVLFCLLSGCISADISDSGGKDVNLEKIGEHLDYNLRDSDWLDVRVQVRSTNNASRNSILRDEVISELRQEEFQIRETRDSPMFGGIWFYEKINKKGLIRLSAL
ncbi:MAG: hypothetical protein GF334_13500 [Candidatus Altiarchaeales archaeon]|nr:hypothetical protein [Candidatus Altiarchaeales archaeon]